MELELPRLLAPDLPSNRYSAVCIRYNPLHPEAIKTAGILFFVAASLCVSIGQFARLLLTVVMVAVSQAPSPESNPNPPLPVRGKVVHYTTFYLIGGEFVQQRAARRFRYIGLRQQLHLPDKRRWSLFRPVASLTPTPNFLESGLTVKDLSSRY